MKVNYVLMYGTPYLRYKEFETFEDISKFLVHKGYVDYSIFKKLEDKEEVEMIYRDNDIHYLEKENKRLNKKIEQYENPEDMTLMFMWCDEKAKEEIERLNNLLKETSQILSEQTTKAITLKSENERLNKELKSLQDSYDIEEEQANYHIDLTDDLREEVDRLNNIINEVGEYIDKFIKVNYEDVFNQEQKEYMVKILQILDKEKLNERSKR